MGNETTQAQAATMEIGLLIGSLDQLEEVAAWGYDYAEISPGLLGVDEDADEDTVLAFASTAGTPIESSETPWCAIFVNAMFAACGLKTTGTMRARDFAEWGQACEERVGAIVMYKSHVGFVPEPGKVLGGNQSDGVNIGEQRWYGTPIAY